MLAQRKAPVLPGLRSGKHRGDPSLQEGRGAVWRHLKPADLARRNVEKAAKLCVGVGLDCFVARLSLLAEERAPNLLIHRIADYKVHFSL